MTIEFSIHWLTTTAWSNSKLAHNLWETHFHQYLGNLNPGGNKKHGFATVFTAQLNSKLSTDPIQSSSNGSEYVSFDFPGSACEALPPEVMVDFYANLQEIGHVRTTRLDMAWDYVKILPSDIRDAVLAGNIRSAVHRKSLSYYSQPLEKDALGKIGTNSVRLGSNNSLRQLKVYDRRGFSKLEFKTRKSWAELITKDLVIENPKKWSSIARSHLRDFIDFEHKGSLLPWWKTFTFSVSRARKQLVNPKTIELSRKTNWIEKQVSPTISALVDIYGQNYLFYLYDLGKFSRVKRYESFIIENEIFREQ